MAKTYAVKILTPKEWDAMAERMGCPHLDDTNLGVADPKHNIGYIKSTHSHRLNAYLLNHEFEHLTESEGTDECACGLRHKKGKDIFRNITAIALAPFTAGGSLGVGPLGGARIATQDFEHATQKAIPKEIPDAAPAILGTVGYAAGGPTGAAAGAALGRGIKESYEGPDENRNALGIVKDVGRDAAIGYGIGSGAKAIGSFVTPAQTSGANALSAAPKATSPSISAPGGIGESGGAFKIKSPINSFGLNPGANIDWSGIKQTTPLTAPQQAFLPPVMPQVPSANQNQTGGQPGVTQQQSNSPSPLPQPQQPNALDRLKATVGKIGGALGFSQGAGQPGQPQAGLNVKDLALPGALLVAGQQFGKSPEVPDLRGLAGAGELPGVQSLVEASKGQGVSDLGRLAQKRLTEQLDVQAFQGLPGEESSAIKNVFERKRRELASYYKYFRPTANIAEDSQFRQAMSEIDQAEADAMAGQTRQARTQFETQRRQDIQTALGVDTQTLDTLATLAQLDVDQIQLRTGVSAQEAQDIREAFGNLAVASMPGANVGGVTFRVG